MTLILGITAALLLMVLIGLVAKSSSSQGDVLAFTSPEDLEAASAHAAMAVMAPSRPTGAGSTANTATAWAAPSAGSTTSDFYPGNLGIGTSLTYRGEASEIVGVISFEFDGEVWRDYLAALPGGRWWRLGVEPDSNMQLVAFTPTTSQVEPGPGQITYEGEVFTMSESGPANYRTVGQTGRFESGRYFFFDYRNEAGLVLNFERFDSSPWVVSLGNPVHPSQVEICNFAGEPNH